MKFSSLPKRKVFIFENSYKLTNELLKFWTRCAQDAIVQKSFFSAALSGGHSPQEFYCTLGGLSDSPAWEKTFLFQTDERFVPPDDRDNNARMIRENLIETLPLREEQIVFIDTKTSSAQEAAERYEQQVRAFWNKYQSGVPGFDLALLGVGNDGHTASLFPGTGALDGSADKAVISVRGKDFSYERISITLSVINHSRYVVFLILGAEKSGVTKRILEGYKDLPASYVRPDCGEVYFFIDQYAASDLDLPDDFSHHGDAVFFEF